MASAQYTTASIPVPDTGGAKFLNKNISRDKRSTRRRFTAVKLFLLTLRVLKSCNNVQFRRVLLKVQVHFIKPFCN